MKYDGLNSSSKKLNYRQEPGDIMALASGFVPILGSVAICEIGARIFKATEGHSMRRLQASQ